MAPRAKPEPAGHYPQALATCIVDGIEDEFNATFVIGDPALKVRRPRCPRRCSNVRADGLREVRCRNRCALRVGHHGPHQCRRCSFTDESPHGCSSKPLGVLFAARGHVQVSKSLFEQFVMVQAGSSLNSQSIQGLGRVVGHCCFLSQPSFLSNIHVKLARSCS